MTKILTIEDILNSNDRPLTEVSVPEWGGTVHVRVMSGNERDAFEADMIDRRGSNGKNNLRGIRASLCVRVLCDSEGNRLFKDKDADKLGEKSAAALDRIFEAAQAANGMSNKDVDELAGNSESDQSEDSGSSLPLP